MGVRSQKLHLSSCPQDYRVLCTVGQECCELVGNSVTDELTLGESTWKHSKFAKKFEWMKPFDPSFHRFSPSRSQHTRQLSRLARPQTGQLRPLRPAAAAADEASAGDADTGLGPPP